MEAFYRSDAEATPIRVVLDMPPGYRDRLYAAPRGGDHRREDIDVEESQDWNQAISPSGGPLAAPDRRRRRRALGYVGGEHRPSDGLLRSGRAAQTAQAGRRHIRVRYY